MIIVQTSVLPKLDQSTNKWNTLIVESITPQTVTTEKPQKVYDTKKQIFHANKVVWYILGVIEVLLGFRFILKLLGANYGGFTNLIYSVTSPLAQPFAGIFRTVDTGASLVEWTTLLAMAVYLVLAWGIVYLIDLFNPATPKEVIDTV